MHWGGLWSGWGRARITENSHITSRASQISVGHGAVERPIDGTIFRRRRILLVKI
jgi:hypothetical protein